MSGYNTPSKTRSAAAREKEMKRFTGTIREDLIEYILLRVPDPETLVQLKSVSKSWLSLISSPNFAKSHLAITASKEKEEIHIVHTCNKEKENDSISLINFSTPQLVTRLNFPSFLCKRLVGSACGIVCFYSTISDGSKMYLWNPATNRFKHIPSPSTLSDMDSLGFNFNKINNDFKIVRVVCPFYLSGVFFPRDSEENYAEVYSSNRNVWRKLPDRLTDIPYLYEGFDVSVNTGLLCSAGHDGIITFNLHTEVLNCAAIKYPVPTYDANDANINNFCPGDARALTNFKDSIAVIIYKHSDSRYSDLCKFNLWALDNVECLHGGEVEASWTLIFNIDVDLNISLVRGYVNCGDLLLCLRTWDMCLYNSNSKEPIYLTDSFYFGQNFKYSKSLFTISGFKPVNWNVVTPES